MWTASVGCSCGDEAAAHRPWLGRPLPLVEDAISSSAGHRRFHPARVSGHDDGSTDKESLGQLLLTACFCIK
ncbi:unnamed protein product [Protopolystoma xenopodis]|uniref:Uncharacterized protein n=1 Tax=Protopolystoma xenopodis TaxID=117903 RepID=A0A448X1M1_9PLAT|nr:unnamed protein product [Protopolystoma xenopodis]